MVKVFPCEINHWHTLISVKRVYGCKVSPLVWSIFVGQNADPTSGRDCIGTIGYGDELVIATVLVRNNWLKMTSQRWRKVL